MSGNAPHQSAALILELLQDAGRRGITVPEVMEATGFGKNNALARLGLLVRDGAAVAREDLRVTVRGIRAVKRWYLAEFAPREAAVNTGPVVPPRTWTSWEGLAPRTAPSVISAAECRPWAAAAAGGRA